MARKSQENPALDMTPMIDVVFELIIFFVVTLTEAQKKDDTIELEDGRHGVVLTPEELPPQHMQVDIGVRNGKAPTRHVFRNCFIFTSTSGKILRLYYINHTAD